MALLSNAERGFVHAIIMRKLSEERSSVSIIKADLLAAVNAIDDFFDTNATAINNAFPQPARSALSTRQKAMILLYVINRRFEVF